MSPAMVVDGKTYGAERHRRAAHHALTAQPKAKS